MAAKKQIKFHRDTKGSNDGHTVLRFDAGKTYDVGDEPDQVGPELVKAFTEDQKFKNDKDEWVAVAELVEAKGDAAKAKTVANEAPPAKPEKKD